MQFSVNYMMIFLLVVNGYLFVTTHAEPTLLEKVCYKTRDVDFCLTVFGSDPATRTASLTELGQIAIDNAADKEGRTAADINQRLLHASDPKLKSVLAQCLHGYDNALATLRKAWNDLQKGQYMDLYLDANDAAWGFFSCEQAFAVSSLPSPLTTENLHLSNYCNILQIIANASY